MVHGVGRSTGRGRFSGVDADWQLAIVYTIRDGRILRGEDYFDRAEALEAVGLQPKTAPDQRDPDGRT